MLDRIARLAVLRRLTRVATLRQLQAVSNTLRLATGRTLDSFKLPARAHVRPVEPGEVRVIERVGDCDIAWLTNSRTKTCVQVLPDDVTDLPLYRCCVFS